MVDDLAGLDPELVRFLREELAVEVAAASNWQVTTTVLVWHGKADSPDTASTVAWHYLAITGDVVDAIRAAAPGRKAAWGSVYVTVTLGGTSWNTSLFPSKDIGGYFLPLKLAVRKKEKVAEGDVVNITLALQAKAG